MQNFEVEITEDFFKETVRGLNRLRGPDGYLPDLSYNSNCIIARKLREKGLEDPTIDFGGFVYSLDRQVSCAAIGALVSFDRVAAGGAHVEPNMAWDSYSGPKKFMMFDD